MKIGLFWVKLVTISSIIPDGHDIPPEKDKYVPKTDKLEVSIKFTHYR